MSLDLVGPISFPSEFDLGSLNSSKETDLIRVGKRKPHQPTGSNFFRFSAKFVVVSTKFWSFIMKLEITWKITLSFLVNDANYGNTMWNTWQYHVAHVKRKKKKAFRWNMWLTQFCCHFNIFVIDGFLFWPYPKFQRLRFDQRNCFFQLWPTYVCILLYLKINFITCWTEWMLFIMIYFKTFTSVGICFENIIVTKVLKHFHWVFLAAIVLVVHMKIIFVIVVVVIVILTNIRTDTHKKAQCNLYTQPVKRYVRSQILKHRYA